MIENAAWLPCLRCGQLPPDCLERPVAVAVWERSLRHSKAERDEEARRAERRRQAARWIAA